MKNACLHTGAVLTLLWAAGCDRSPSSPSHPSANSSRSSETATDITAHTAAHSAGVPQVITTFYPTFYFASRIAGDLIKVECPLPPDADPIFWKPDGATIARYQTADLIILNGADYERWVNTASLPLSRLCDSAHTFESEFIKLEGIKHSHGGAGAHSHEGIDGHTWMDPANATRQAEQIMIAMARKWPMHEQAFRNHFRALADDLANLSARLGGLSEAASQTTLIASHPAYGYIAERFTWHITTIDLPPDVVPNSDTLQNLNTALASTPRSILLFESEPIPSVLESVKAIPGLRPVVFSPAETLSPADATAGIDYLSIMNANIDRLESALGLGAPFLNHIAFQICVLSSHVPPAPSSSSNKNHMMTRYPRRTLTSLALVGGTIAMITASLATTLLSPAFAQEGTTAQPVSPSASAMAPSSATQPATQPAKREKKALDPDLLLHVGITAGRIKGSNFTDETGKVSGQVIGNPMKTNIGPGGGFKFNGTTDWLLIADDIAKQPAGLPTGEFTVSVWLNPSDPTARTAIIGCIQDQGSEHAGWSIGIDANAFTFSLAGASSSTPSLTTIKSASNLQPDHWYHIAATYDRRSMKLFVNGELQAESREQSGDVRYAATAAYTIASYQDSVKRLPMNGTLLEVKVLGRALNAQQVTEEYTPGVRLTSFRPEVEATQRFIVKPYLQFITTDSATIMWETSRPGESTVEYGEALPYAQRTSPTSSGTLHKVVLTGLTIETPYFYRVRTIEPDGNEILGDDLTFQTAIRPDTPFAFAIIGDTQKNKPVIGTLQSFAFSLRPNFEIHLGDVVDKGADRDEWVNEFLAASFPLMGRVCMYPSIGNHEENHSNYYTYFSMPEPKCWYTYTYGNAQMFVLDTNKAVDPDSEQYKWLDNELAKSTATWKFVYHHHPVYSSDENDYGDTYKEKSFFCEPRHRVLAALFEKHHVDIDFNGHIHCYERSWPIFEGKVDQARGVRYITSGGGGAGLESASPTRTWFMQRSYRGHHICQVMIHGKTLQFQAFDVEGRLFDQMDITKP